MKRILYFFVIFIITMFLWQLLQLIFDEKDFCLDTGVCKEGATIYVENGEAIVVNKASCLKNNGIWDNKTRHCKF